jgi:hypothetical protein
MAQTTEELAAQYRREAMEHALQTKQRFDLYGLRFNVDRATIQPASESLLNDIATALKSFPDWQLRIVGHTDSTGDAELNKGLSLERANAIKAALVQRGIADQRLIALGAGEEQPMASNSTPSGRALNRRVELVRFSDSVEARTRLKAMSDYLVAQKFASVSFDSLLEVVTTSDQKLALASSGTVTLSRPDWVRATRSGGFADVEILFDGKTLTLLGKNINRYIQVAMPGTVDHLIDELKDTYNRPLPAADLLLTNAYEQLMQGVFDSKDLGSGVIGGTECDSFAFRKEEVDWQIWIAQGDRPYPCRFVVTSKFIEREPQYSIQFRDWKFGDDVTVRNFTFQNPSNAEKVELRDLQDKIGDLPPQFTLEQQRQTVGVGR